MNTKQVPAMVDESKGAPMPMSTGPLTPMEMLNAALARGADLDILTKLMDLQERWERSQARKAFDDAIAAAKAEIPPIVKNRTGHGDRKYADMAAIANAIDPIITKHGLSYRYRTVQTDRITVTCILAHRAGHYEETTLSGPADMSGSKNAIQAIGSTLTYLQRYSIMQALGLAVTEDDDGEASAKRIANGDFSGDYDDGVPHKLTKAPATPPPIPERKRFQTAEELWQQKIYNWMIEVDGIETISHLDAWISEHSVQAGAMPVRHKELQTAIYRHVRLKREALHEAELANQVVHDSDDLEPRPATAEDFEDEPASISEQAIKVRETR